MLMDMDIDERILDCSAVKSRQTFGETFPYWEFIGSLLYLNTHTYPILHSSVGF